jgi:L-alanine-DL-glutamate epimerase-like enolase superfamily enzyme
MTPWKHTTYIVESPLKAVFRIANLASPSTHNVLLRLDDGEAVGWGAACVNNVTGETASQIAGALDAVVAAAAARGGTDPEAILPTLGARLAAQAPAALTAFDMALYDLASRRAGLPLYQYLARQFGTTPRESIVTDNTIGIEPLGQTLAIARRHLADGFRTLKLKIGEDFSADMERVRRLRDLAGPDIGILADANQGYTVEQAVACTEVLRECGYLYLEQPVARDDLAALAEVTRRAAVPIFADEAAKGLPLATRICRERLAHGLNIKLMKLGGIRQAVEVVRLAREHGLDLMVGCYNELSLSIAAGLHFALAFPAVRYADLDSHLMLRHEPCRGVQLGAGGQLRTAGPGLGITVDEGWLKEHT